MRKIYMSMAFMLGMLIAICWAAPVHAERYHHSYHGDYSHHQYGNHGYHRGDWQRGLFVGAIVGGLIYEANRPRVIESYPSYEPNYTNPSYVSPSWHSIYVREFDPGCGCYITVMRYEDRWGNIH